MDWLADWFQVLWDWLTSIWTQLSEWVQDIFATLWDAVLDAVLAVLNTIPVPTWAENLSLDWVPVGMAYFLEPFQIPLALTCVTGGYLIRFLIRRIPVIG